MRLVSYLVVTAGLGAPLLAGCSATSSDASAGRERTGETTSAIQGGTSDSTDTFTVGVCLPARAGLGPGNCETVCTGVLIAPNLVVTARHCVDTIATETVDCSTATFGGLTAPATDYYVTTASSMEQTTDGWHRVASIATPTASDVCGNDIALLQLDEIIASSEAQPATPAVQYPIYNHNHYGTSETAIGYGESTPGDPESAEMRRQRQNTPIVCVYDDPFPAEDCVTQNADWTTFERPNEFVAGAGTCSGDSGSGAFDQTLFQEGNATVLGVLSRGSETDAGVCSTAIYTRLDSFRDFLVSGVTSAATAGGYDVPSWTVAVPDDGTYPSGDSGASSHDAAVASDGGASTVTPGLGGACTAQGGCSVGTCENNGTATVCATSCDPTMPDECPTGFTCASAGLCFVTGVATTTMASTTASSGGCNLGLAGPGETSGSAGFPWLTSVLGLLGVRLGRRRASQRARRTASFPMNGV